MTQEETQGFRDLLRIDVDQLRQAAEQGDAVAQYVLGLRYSKGEGVYRP